DHFTGYTLTIAGSNDTGRLVGSNDSTKYLSSITTPLTEAQFNTDAHNDQWGFLPGALYNASTSTTINNTDYQPSPIHTTPTTMDVTNSPTDNDGNDYTLALASRISPNMSLDSYGQTFVLAATGNGYDYHIGYTDDLADIPDDQYDTGASSNTVQLSSTVPVKAGYVFRGWCSEKTTNGGVTCPGTTYQPGDTITLDGSNGNDYDLHTIWDPVTFAEAGATNMQSMTTAICNAVAIGQEATLSDTRGGSYRVGKMKDGKCWMLDNLALGGSSEIGLTPDNTNISANYTLPATRTDGFTVYNEPRINIAYNATVPQGDDPLKQQALAGDWKVGTYYNYCAASAGSYCPAAGAAAGPVEQDICPKGWRVPSAGPGGEYQVIYDAYGKNYTNFRTALHLPLSGTYYSAEVYTQGSGGYWWSSTFNNGNSMYHLYSLTSGINPQAASHRDYGFSVRCVAK
ncbi:hypothetical protein IKE87_01510, partial [Candidatus Saccharibacteria bacterium]|nr:hypothetical protein [Candidatus Saccharibacteria bacterium]